MNLGEYEKWLLDHGEIEFGVLGCDDDIYVDYVLYYNGEPYVFCVCDDNDLLSCYKYIYDECQEYLKEKEGSIDE